MNKEIVDILNKQINKELEVAYLYLDIANHFDSTGLDGYSHYYRIEAKEEIDQAMKIYKYLHSNNYKVKLMIINENKKVFDSILEVLEYGKEVEKDVTKSIEEIYKLADEKGDLKTMEFITWFIARQTAKEEAAQKILDESRAFKEAAALYSLNNKYRTRNYARI